MTDAFREYLYRPADLAKELRDAEEQAHQLWAVCTKMTTSFGNVGGGSGGDAKDGALAAYAELAKGIEKRRAELEETENEMREFLISMYLDDSVYGTRDELILRMKYLEHAKWDAIYRALRRRGFWCGHMNTAYNWHRQALARAEKYWEETHEPTEQAG